MLRLAQKSVSSLEGFRFPLLHVDTSYKFPEMIEFRDEYPKQIGAELLVHKNQEALDAGANPFVLGTQKMLRLAENKNRCWMRLRKADSTPHFGGARRDEEKSRAKERIYSFRDVHGQWDPKNQRPELWNIFNSKIDKGESIRIFPALQLDGTRRLAIYLHGKYSDLCRSILRRSAGRSCATAQSFLIYPHDQLRPGEKVQSIKCRMRVARLCAVHGSDPVGCRYRSQNHRGDDFVPSIRA